jgi:hypothetical protein
MGPQITVYDKTNTSVESTWNVGTIRAQEPSEVYTINIWNNKGGVDHVSDLRDCYISILDYDGDSAIEDVARDRWIQVNIPSVDGDENTWTSIGGSFTKEIRANGGVSENTLSGIANSGVLSNSPKNVCTANFRVYAPPNSNPGQKLFKIRVNGYFT